jgi:AraC-like DNA-binding protein
MDYTATVNEMNQMDNLEFSLRCVEKNTQLMITIHDLKNQLGGALEYSRFIHRHPLCFKQKNIYQQTHKCVKYEKEDFQAVAAENIQGRLNRCFAGVTEMVLPLFIKEDLHLVIFAGPLLLNDSELLDYDIYNSKKTNPDLTEEELPLYKKDDLPYLWECLYQLSSRLRCYLLEQKPVNKIDKALPRRLLIKRYIEMHHTQNIQLTNLAKFLHLSNERCRHVIIEELGENFSKLLRNARIKTACQLLLNTNQPLSYVAEYCGLKDLSGFSRAFQAIMECSPGKWRRLNKV